MTGAHPHAAAASAAGTPGARIMVTAHRLQALAAAHASDSDDAWMARQRMTQLLIEAPADDAPAQDKEMWRICRQAAGCWAEAAAPRYRRRWGLLLRAAAEGVMRAEADAGEPEPDERKRGRDAALPD